MQAACKMQPCEWYAVGLSFGAEYSLKIEECPDNEAAAMSAESEQENMIHFILSP